MRFAFATLLPLFASSVAFAQNDQDHDNVADWVDPYPCDGAATSIGFAPAQSTYGMMMFEDLWPAQGDLDFNDVVLAYNFVYRMNAAGQVLSLHATIHPLALGGQFSNGLALHLPVARARAASVTRRVGDGQPETLAVSTGDQELTFRISANLRETFGGTSGQINSLASAPRTSGSMIQVDVTFDQPISLATGNAPYDLFIFRADNPSHEIHRPEFGGSNYMDHLLFGTYQDGSSSTRRFVDVDGLPFALVLPELAPYPAEEVEITTLFPNIAGFASSAGANNRNFYSTSVNANSAFRDANGAGRISPSNPTSMDIDRSCVPAEPEGHCVDRRQNGSETGVDCGGSCSAPCMRIALTGHADVLIGCAGGDYDCQAHLTCNAVTGYDCVFQQYDCYYGNQGSYYPQDGSSGTSYFNFAIAYDFAGGNYGNICAASRQSQLSRYGLTGSGGLGHWTRVAVFPTCFDGTRNQDETAVDCGGVCGGVCPTCSDGIQNQAETRIDCGGPNCTACPTCTDGIRNQNETGLDCGGVCNACPTCNDGVQNQNEQRIDCGGPNCAPCPGNCTDGEQNGIETGIDCGGNCRQCMEIQLTGHASVYVGCAGADYDCQARLTCNAVTGMQCVYQQYDCYYGNTGSYYPPDGLSGTSYFNFAISYDFVNGYGNICAASRQSQLARYGLAGTSYSPSLGHWTRVAVLPTCTDGVRNQNETGVDCGGVCGGICPTCTDGIQNQGETRIDCGGANCSACPTCTDGIQNQGETQIDCGGANCSACPSCFDGIRNQNEVGTDCGGVCNACPGNCTDRVQNGTETGIDCGGNCTTACLEIQLTGHAPVYVGCAAADYNCQANLTCNAVTGYQCVYQQYDCYYGNQGSYYPPDGLSGTSYFNFAITYDFAGGTYGNICAASRQTQLARYGLTGTGGLGHWTRVASVPTCSDGVRNQNEVGIDCGGVCSACVGNCTNRMRDGAETGVDCGGSCSTACLSVPVDGRGNVLVGCARGDYNCQSNLICNAITGLQCVYQQYDCYWGNTGSYYPPDGSSGGSNFNFAIAYDLGGGSYGNICGVGQQSQFARYGLTNNGGLGRWYRQ